MFGLTALSGGGSPVTAAELRDRLRLNDSAEDSALEEFLSAAVDLFEHETGRAVLATTFRQDLSAWPCGPIVLGRGGVSSVEAVSTYTADGSTSDLTATQWRADLLTAPARITLATTPSSVTTAAGIAVTPVGYVRFVAGWASAAVVPPAVKLAIKLLAGHYYEHREAFGDVNLVELPAGWRRVVDKYRTGISGTWGQ